RTLKTERDHLVFEVARAGPSWSLDALHQCAELSEVEHRTLSATIGPRIPFANPRLGQQHLEHRLGEHTTHGTPLLQHTYDLCVPYVGEIGGGRCRTTL